MRIAPQTFSTKATHHKQITLSPTTTATATTAGLKHKEQPRTMAYTGRLQSPRPSSSAKPSRPQSRQQGADAAEEDELMNYGLSFQNLDQLIADRLEKFYKSSTNEGIEQTKLKYPMHNVRKLIDLLINTKQPIPSQDREMMLNQVYTLVVKSPRVSDGLFEDCCKLLKSSAGYERLLAVRIVAAVGVVQSDDVTDEIIDLLTYLEKKIVDDDLENTMRVQYVYAYGVLTLVVFEGSGSFGVDDRLRFLTETLMGFQTDSDVDGDVIGSLVYAIGGCFTLLLNNSNINEELQITLESTVDYLLDYDNLSIQRPMSMLAALAYEIYQYVDDPHAEDYDLQQESQPYYNTYLIEQRLQELVGSVKMTKKNDSRKVFREALHTVQFYSERSNRIQSSDKSYDESKDEQILAHIRLSKTRSIAVKSWVSLFRLVLLKWAFGVGLYNQLANSSSLANMVSYTRPRTSFVHGTQVPIDSDDEYHGASKMSNKLKEKEIAKKRMEKLNDRLEQAGLKDD